MRYYYKNKDNTGFLNLKSQLVDNNYIEITEEEFNELTKLKKVELTEEQKKAIEKQKQISLLNPALIGVGFFCRFFASLRRKRKIKPR